MKAAFTGISLAVLLASTTLLGPLGAGTSAFPHGLATGVPDSQVIVALIDTGADGWHSEFGGFLGQPGVTDPQIVAWYDFGTHDPAVALAGATWDAATPTPFDSCPGFCHGTGTASLVGGKTLGAYPGVKLAIAKVANGAGDLVNIDQAIAWATHVVGADVISVSLGTIIPFVGFLDTDDEAVRDAYDAGTLTVIAAGNGLGDAGVRYPSETDSPAYSPYALVVGAAGRTGAILARTISATFSNTDPDVIAWGAGVRMAQPNNSTTIADGTSFSTPLVAGYAAKAKQAAMDHGKPSDPGRITQLVEWTANDMVQIPYALEGFGFVDDGRGGYYDTVAPLLQHAAAGTLPPPPSLENQIAHGNAIALRITMTETTSPGSVIAALPNGEPNFIGASGPTARNSDAWGIALQPGDSLAVSAVWDEASGISAHAVDAPTGDSVVAGNDLDVFLYRPGAGAGNMLSSGDLLASSAHEVRPGTNVEAFTYRAQAAGTYKLLVEGWSVVHPGQAYTLQVTVNGQAASPGFLGDSVVADSGLFLF